MSGEEAAPEVPIKEEEAAPEEAAPQEESAPAEDEIKQEEIKQEEVPAEEANGEAAPMEQQQAPAEPEEPENENAKIIVRQINYKTSEDTLREYFASYGEISKLNLKTNSDGTSRGFGFIVFKEEATVSKVLEVEEHSIDDRKVMVDKATPLAEKMNTTKMFIGKLANELTEEDLKTYFGTFGEVKTVEFVFNRTTNERRGFCFIEMCNADDVEKITEGKIPPNSATHTINEHEIVCRKKFDDDHPVQKKLKQRERNNRMRNYGYDQGGYGGGYGAEFRPV